MKTRYSPVVLAFGLIGQGAAAQFSIMPYTSGAAQSHEQASPDLRGGAPPNDECDGATVHVLASGASIPFSGSTEGATDSEGIGFLTTWEAFSIAECAYVALDYCGNDPVYGGVVTGLGTDCPLTAAIDTMATTGCADGNAVLFYGPLDPGTYWFIQAAVPGQVEPGPYSGNLTAVPCDIGLAERAATDMTISPNPGRDVFSLRYTGASGLANIEVMDVAGRMVHGEQILLMNGATHSIDLSMLVAGNYTVRVTTGGVRTAQRLVIE